MPYDEVCYQNLEEGEKNLGEKISEGQKGKIRKLLRNETFELSLCLTLSGLILGINFYFGGNL